MNFSECYMALLTSAGVIEPPALPSYLAKEIDRSLIFISPLAHSFFYPNRPTLFLYSAANTVVATRHRDVRRCAPELQTRSSRDHGKAVENVFGAGRKLQHLDANLIIEVDPRKEEHFRTTFSLINRLLKLDSTAINTARAPGAARGRFRETTNRRCPPMDLISVRRPVKESRTDVQFHLAALRGDVGRLRQLLDTGKVHIDSRDRAAVICASVSREAERERRRRRTMSADAAPTQSGEHVPRARPDGLRNSTSLKVLDKTQVQ
ncbi:hypothetical protein EVAR_33532_1 [Eumeta japonica]|uniref:Uncharacterized protein n=1 Tax=Eumeta variegata TaxID=151549 RepID=A0A4C1VJM4_EUMVA|nr:hypothetical protein EVAR_33532_1 [Eumeta japonica]